MRAPVIASRASGVATQNERRATALDCFVAALLAMPGAVVETPAGPRYVPTAAARRSPAIIELRSRCALQRAGSAAIA
jgi:hypothetical protein